MYTQDYVYRIVRIISAWAIYLTEQGGFITHTELIYEYISVLYLIQELGGGLIIHHGLGL